MQVVATALLPGVSITLLEGADGWRFVAWSTVTAPLAEPSPAARALRFTTQADAMAYFRSVCPVGPQEAAD
jgi:hypothetical protein